jgi:cytochrome c oxidase cbb3-type subunit 1
MIIAALFHMTPRMAGREIWSKKMIEAQFWIQSTGIVLYFSSMWIAGITQGMMWRATDQFGNLAYSFIDTVTVLHPYYTIRGVGGLLFLIGALMWAFNIFMTFTAGKQLEREPQNATPTS